VSYSCIFHSALPRAYHSIDQTSPDEQRLPISRRKAQ